MKKLLCIFLCAVLISAPLCLAVSAKEDDIEYNGYPVIMVPGYSSCFLVNTDTGEEVWGGVDQIPILDMVLDNLVKLGRALGAMTVGNADKIAEFIGDGILLATEQIRCDDNGNSVYPLERKYVSAEDTQYSTLIERYPEGGYRSETDICGEIAEYIGYENIFNFTTDFRMGSEICAETLNEYIDDVKQFTGKDKVNIIAVSHGGQTVSTYLTLYGYEKNDVANACLTVPAIGGAGFAVDPLSQNVKLDEECLARFLEHGFRSEADYDWFVKAQQLGFLDTIIEKIVPYVLGLITKWGSIWDFVPVNYYEDMKALRLDPDVNAEIIRKSDRYHYEIQPLVAERMNQCEENGANITIIAGCGNPIVTGLQENSDAIITTTCSTGATCAPYGERFADGYTQINDCDGKYKVNPSMTVDASTAYMPDDTFFVEGLFHGMVYWDYYTRELMMRTVLDDKIQDVYSDPKFPQFHDSTNPSYSVFAAFNGCQEGYIDSNATSLKITNCCWESDVTVTGVTIDGIDLKFKVKPQILKPGESMDVEFTGSIPEVSKKEVNINVNFLIGTATPLCYRTQGFTVMNGDDVKYDNGYVNAKETALNKLLGEKMTAFLKKLGLNEFFSMFFNTLLYWIRTVF